MVDIKKIIWVFPIIGFILGIIIFLAPIMVLNTNTFYSIDWYYWIWGLTSYSYRSLDPWDPNILDIMFTHNVTLLTVSIISTVTIAVGLTLLLIAGISSKRNIRYSKKFMVMTGISVILLITGGIIFYVGAGWPTTQRSLSSVPGQSVSNLINGGFGMIALFIGSGVALLGIPLHYYGFKRKIKIPFKGEKINLKTKGLQESQGLQESERFQECIRLKKYLWVLPIIAAIFGIITFLAPAITLNNRLMGSINWNYWIWGLTSYSMISPDPYYYPSISEIAITNNSQLLTVSIISTIMISIAVIILLIAARNSKRNIHYSKKFMTRAGFSAILLIVGGIIFWVGADWPTTLKTGSVPYDIGVWDYLFKEGFSVFSPFIGGGIALVGLPVHYIIYKFRIDTSIKRGEVSLEIAEFKEKIDKIYTLETETNEKLANLEKTQNKILYQIVDLKKGEELENPPI